MEGALEHAEMEKAVIRQLREQQLQQQIPALQAIFRDLDVDGSGVISLEEIESVPENLKQELLVVTGVEDMDDLFELLDKDASGYVEIDEFIEALKDLVMSQISVETFRVMKHIFANRSEIERNSLGISNVKEVCDKIVDLLHEIRGGPIVGYRM